MVSSACDTLLGEPDRFIDYIVSDSRLRSKIYDDESFIKALEASLRSDPTLKNIADTIRSEKESFEICGASILKDRRIQNIIEGNIDKKTKDIKKKIRRDKPQLKGRAFNREVNRRLKISIGVSKKKKLKQISIEEATRPVRVTLYERAGKEIGKHRRTAPRTLTKQETMLIRNAVRKKKMPNQVINDYYNSGLKFRTRESIRKHYYRIKRKL